MSVFSSGERGEPLGFVISARVCLSLSRARARVEECVGHRHHHRRRRRERREYKGVGVNGGHLRLVRSVAKFHPSLTSLCNKTTLRRCPACSVGEGFFYQSLQSRKSLVRENRGRNEAGGVKVIPTSGLASL